MAQINSTMEQKIKDGVARIAKAKEQMDKALASVPSVAFVPYDAIPWIRVDAGIRNVAIAFDVPVVTISADGDSAAVVHIPALGMTLFQKIAE